MSSLSLTGKQWVLHDDRMDDGSLIDTLLERRKLEALGAGELLDTFGHDGRHFQDYAAAEKRILRAIKKGETVGVFGDYDCDGITSATLLTRFLQRHGIRPVVRLPHRLKEGYGLQTYSIDEFSKANVTLLLTVDTGVTAVDPVDEANARGIDVIILDHHTIPAVLPKALAILHPERTKPLFDSAPCGAGVAFSMIRAIEEGMGNTEWPDRNTDIALAAIGTVADIVELRGGNRTLTHSGLVALAQLRDGPLALLCANAGLTAPYTSRDIGFRIAPRINAAGRMADPSIAFHALMGDSTALLELDALNNKRQDVVNDHLEELLPKADNDESHMLCFIHEDYSPGICGLLAGRLCESFGKPSLIAGQIGTVCAASLRSVPGYDVTAGLSRGSHLLLNFGGHAMAAGCTFRRESFEALREHMIEDMRVHFTSEKLVPTLVAECALDIAQVTQTFCDSLSVLEPFGQGNPEPRFLLENVQLENVRGVGQKGKHLQATVRGRKMIGFGLGHLADQTTQPLDLLCKVGMNVWLGRKTPQLFVDDMRVTNRTEITREVKKPETRSRVR